MATMAEIERDYPERRAALVAAMGTVSLAEFGENIAAGLRNFRPAVSLGSGPGHRDGWDERTGEAS